MEQWLPIVIIVLCVAAPSLVGWPWVEVVVSYLALYVPWKMQKIMAEVKKINGSGGSGLASSLAKARSSLRGGPKK